MIPELVGGLSGDSVGFAQNERGSKGVDLADILFRELSVDSSPFLVNHGDQSQGLPLARRTASIHRAHRRYIIKGRKYDIGVICRGSGISKSCLVISTLYPTPWPPSGGRIGVICRGSDISKSSGMVSTLYPTPWPSSGGRCPSLTPHFSEFPAGGYYGCLGCTGGRRRR